MSTPQSSDIFLVNRDGSSYKVTLETIMSTLDDTDLLLVNRGGSSYKITAADFKASVIPFTLSVTLSRAIVQVGLFVTAQPVITGGSYPFTYSYQWKTKDINNNVTNITGATSSSYIAVQADLGKSLACEVTVTDNASDSLTETTAYTGAVAAASSSSVLASTRFNSADSAYLNWRPDSAGDRRKWTFSCWFKRSKLGVLQQLFGAGQEATNDGKYSYLRIDSDDKINFRQWNDGGSLDAQLTSSAVLRDVSAFYNLVFAYDSSQSTDSNKIKIYLNGEQITAFDSSDYPALNALSQINAYKMHTIASANDGGSQSSFFDGQIANVNFVDALQLDATSFGETDGNGKWVPKAYTTYVPTGIVYSNDVTNSTTGPNLFDGDTTTWCEGTYWSGSNPRRTAKYEPTSPITINSTFELFVYYAIPYQGSGLPNPWIRINGGNSIASGTLTNNSWNTITGYTQLTKLEFQEIAAPWPMKISAIRVDGQILTDDWGHNSSQLAMDPSVVGTTYSDYLTGPEYSNSYSKLYAFNGLTTNYCIATVGNSITFTPPTPITVNSTLEMYCRVENSGGTLWVNGNTISNVPDNQWFTISGISSISSIAWSTVASNINTGVYAIRVDGKILVDYTAIGADSSGLENNWHENNLETYYSSNFYSSDCTGTTQPEPPPAWNVPGRVTSYADAFDGNTAIGCISYIGTGGTVVFTPTSAIPVNTSFEIYLKWNESGNYTYPKPTLEVNGTSYTLTSSNTQFPSEAWSTITGLTEITSIEWKSAATNNANSGTVAVHAIRIDGVILNDLQLTDMLRDSPSDFDDGIYGTGNYATLNPLKAVPGATFSNGNLKVVTGTVSGSAQPVLATMAIPSGSGKYYWEVTAVALANNNSGRIGLVAASEDYYTGQMANSIGQAAFRCDVGDLRENYSTLATGTAISNGDIVGVAYDATNGTLTFYKNGVLNVSATITNEYDYIPAVSDDYGAYSATFELNFGQYPFRFTQPAGYSTLCTFNLPVPVVPDSEVGMQPVLYTGNGTTQSIPGLAFESGLTWIKNRDYGNSHGLFDQVRGPAKSLVSNNANTEDNLPNGLTGWTADGFNIGSDNTVNRNNDNFVAWNWYAGDSTVTVPVGVYGNNLPSLQSEVRANPETGFSCVSYTGTGSNESVSHGLNAQPSMVIVKSLGTRDWMVKHSALSSGYNLALNEADAAWTPTTNGWIDNLTSSTTFGLVTGSTDANNVNQSGVDYIAYLWSEVAGYSRISSYTGNTSNYPLVWCGFKPAVILVKSTTTGNWIIFDNERDPENTDETAKIAPNGSWDENNNNNIGTPSQSTLDFLSNGFKITSTGGTLNDNGVEYIFAAFASAPTKYSNAY